jgi:hypothetical protein
MLLVAEARRTRWSEPLAPLATAARTNVLHWLGALRYPVRSGTHNQTAFALGLIHDAAVALADAELESAARRRALALFIDDAGAPLLIEPSGEDFLSPALMEADLMPRAGGARVRRLARAISAFDTVAARRRVAAVRRGRR